MLNQPNIMELPADDFACRYNEVLAPPDDPTFKGFIPEEIPLIDEIKDRLGRVHTRGCIASNHVNGHWHIGGFQSFGMANSLIKGLRGGVAITASRNSLSSLPSKEELRIWGVSQLERLIASSLDPTSKVSAIANLSTIGVDVQKEAMIIADGEPCKVLEVVANLAPVSRIFVAGQRLRRPYSKAIFILNPSASPFFGFGFTDLKDLPHDLRISGIAIPGNDSYFEIFGKLDEPTNQNSAYGGLHRALIDAGYKIRVEGPHDFPIGIYNGPTGGHGHLSVRDLVEGKEIKAYGFVIHAER